MKVRVIETKDGKYKSEFYSEARVARWEPTYRNMNSIVQNEFPTLEEAINECRWFAEQKSSGKVVYEDDL